MLRAMHTIIWLCYFVLNYLIMVQVMQFNAALLRIACVGAFNMATYFFCYHYLTPLFFKKQRYALLVALGLLITLFSYLIKRKIDAQFVQYFLETNTAVQPSPRLHLITLIPQGMLVLVACLLSILKLNFETEQNLLQARIDEARRELELIKARINPHFLLNTLNNIYAINYASNPKTSEAVMQLSKVLSYTIYRSKSELVSLNEELDSMRALAGLYQLKQNRQLNITFQVEGPVAESSCLVPSMVLFSFLENAFKHSGILTEPDAAISITLRLTQGSLFFACENTVSRASPNVQNGYSNGLGNNALHTLLNRYYAHKYQLRAGLSGKLYTVNLKLDELQT